QLAFAGQAAPDLSALAAAAGAPVRLIQAGIDRIEGRAVGRMLVAVADGDGRAESRLRALGCAIERIGHVAADD
ncbi:NIL domain-containing protein, partial [Methylobacterium symbioticum]|uniref:NIL domain-containing protein n=2 Tax=Methylobacterium TaxID=407 RepID=UPI002452F936